MRKPFGLLVVVASLAALSVGVSTAAFGPSHAQSLAKIRGSCGSGCGNDCSSSDCQKKKLGSPGADCTDNRLAPYSRVDNRLYLCLLPKNNTRQAVSRSILICETPTSRGGQGGTPVDANGLAFICLRPSGRQ